MDSNMKLNILSKYDVKMFFDTKKVPEPRQGFM